MAFTTQIFIFLFFPICFCVFYLVEFLQRKGILRVFLQKIRAADLALIGISSAFYMWACFDDILWFYSYILIVYGLGTVIQKIRGTGFSFTAVQEQSPEKRKFFSAALPVFALASFFVVYLLIHFKYTAMLAKLWDFFFKTSTNVRSVLAPLGISFITFSAISYLADIYMGKAKSGKLIDCALYLTFFPKVVSGPIVLWRDFSCQIRERKCDLTGSSDGIIRLMIGFAKKLILADTFGACIASAGNAVDVPTAVGIGMQYMLQIYYDFSGYSDIAIGLSQMLGFTVKENFNFPYLSCSITEFWRRWHISLGTWFREYIYFPLGGSRVGKNRTIVNIGIVFLLTGIWHGAGWTYMLWGILNGLCNIAEKLLAENSLYRRTPRVVKWLLTMAVTYFCWELFRFDNFSDCKEWLAIMFGLKQVGHIPYGWQYYFDAQMLTLMVVGILGATVFGLPKVQAAYQRAVQTPVGYGIRGLIAVALFVISILFMVNSNYSPFIYFQY